MITTEPRVKKDAYYQAKEASEALGIAPSSLYRYTAAGYIQAKTRKCNGRRVWLGGDIIRLWRFIY